MKITKQQLYRLIQEELDQCPGTKRLYKGPAYPEGACLYPDEIQRAEKFEGRGPGQVSQMVKEITGALLNRIIDLEKRLDDLENEPNI